MDSAIDIASFRAAVGLFHANRGFFKAPKDRFTLLNVAFEGLKNGLGHIFFHVFFFVSFKIFYYFYSNKTFIKRICTFAFMTKFTRNFYKIILLPRIFVLLFYSFLLVVYAKKCHELFIKWNNYRFRGMVAFFWFIVLFEHAFDRSKWAINLVKCGDVETNPGFGPREDFKFMHWNLNSLKAHNFSRVECLKAYNTFHNFHIMAITESSLKNEINDSEIEIEGFIPVRYDLQGTDTHGGGWLCTTATISQ